MKEIKITCKGSRVVSISDLKDFQGNLKELSKEKSKKLKNLILKYGFSFPVFVWEDNIIDGHQRLAVTKELLNNGYSIGDIPVADIEAKDLKEAKEKILAISSKFGDITDEGLYEFMETAGIEFEDIKNDLEFSDIDMNYFEDSFYKDVDVESVEDFKESVGFVIECENLNQLEELKIKLKVKAQKIDYKTFLLKASL